MYILECSLLLVCTRLICVVPVLLFRNPGVLHRVGIPCYRHARERFPISSFSSVGTMQQILEPVPFQLESRSRRSLFVSFDWRNSSKSGAIRVHLTSPSTRFAQRYRVGCGNVLLFKIGGYPCLYREIREVSANESGIDCQSTCFSSLSSSTRNAVVINGILFACRFSLVVFAFSSSDDDDRR